MPIPEVKPNIKKVFLMNVIEVFFAALLIVLVFIVLLKILGGDFLNEILAGFDIVIDINLKYVIWWFTLAIVVVTVIVLIINYFNLGNLRYEFQLDRIVYYDSMLFVLINKKEIPYGNITRIHFDYEGFLNSFFNTGTITIELSAMKEKEFKMEFIEHAEQVAKYIQRRIRDYKSRYYAKRTEEYKIDNILDREGL